MNIGITGADGLIGWHLRAWLRAYRPQATVRLATRTTFADSAELIRFASGLDVVVHCAGMNRGSEGEVEATNVDLARRLVAACATVAASGAPFPNIVYTNSTHVGRDSGYGRGKRLAGAMLAEAATAHGAACANLILPHVFGEFGKPFYNSVVSTFCHQLSHDEVPVIQVDGDLELVHAQAVAARCVAAAEAAEDGIFRVAGRPLKVSALLEKLVLMHECYGACNIVPNLADGLDLALFNTLRSYRFPRLALTPLTLHSDPRGSLFEAIKADNGGQSFLSTTHAGITRGNHFHTYKFERFLVCAGEAEIRLRRLFSDQVAIFCVSGAEPCCIDMPTFHTHNITNVGNDELVTLFWTSEIFDPARPDTFAEAVTP